MRVLLSRHGSRFTPWKRLLLACFALLFASCGLDGGEGSIDYDNPPTRGDVSVSVAANQVVQLGFPHEENGLDLSFVDGWEVEFTTFVVVIGGVELRVPSEDGEGRALETTDEVVLVDLTSEEDGDVLISTIEDVAAYRLDVAFDLSRATAAGRSAGVTEGDKTLMVDNGWSMLIRGTATPTAANANYTEPITFEVGLPIEAQYFDCNNGADGTKGFAVAANSETEIFIFPHLVHLFWDTLGAGNEDLRFDPWAEVAGEDGHVIIDELSTIDLTALQGSDGIPLYDDDGLLEDYNLATFVRRGMLESMHFNGIGFCKKRIIAQ